MPYFDLVKGAVVEPVDLSSIEIAIEGMGGTIDKAEEKATVEELATAVSSIPTGINPAELSALETAIIAKGGTVNKAGAEVTVTELVAAVASIPEVEVIETDLTGVENQIISQGGTVAKAGEKPTAAEIIAGIATIPNERECPVPPMPGVPIGTTITDKILSYGNYLITDKPPTAEKVEV